MSYLKKIDNIDNVEDKVKFVISKIRSFKEIKSFFKELREERPVLILGSFVLITKRKDVLQVFNNETDFSIRLNETRIGEVVGPYMLGRSSEPFINLDDKVAMRKVMYRVDAERIRKIARKTTAKLLPKGSSEIDVVKLISRAVPLAVCAEHFGFKGPGNSTVYRWSQATQRSFFKNVAGNELIHSEAVKAGEEISEYLDELLYDRRKLIENDYSDPINATVVDRMIYETDKNQAFSEESLRSNVAGLMIGAIETTSQAIVHVLEQILIRPEILIQSQEWARANKHKQLEKVVFESLRINPINPLLVRFSEKDSTIDFAGSAIVIPKNKIVFACTSSAMFDDSEVVQPEKFIIGRQTKFDFIFGYGPHQCLGKYTGIAIVTEVISELLKHSLSIPENSKGIDFEGTDFPQSYKISIIKRT